MWDLVPQPTSHKPIGTKWVFQNKLDELGIIVRNKARLVAKEHNQEEDIDYDETYAPMQGWKLLGCCLLLLVL